MVTSQANLAEPNSLAIREVLNELDVTSRARAGVNRIGTGIGLAFVFLEGKNSVTSCMPTVMDEGQHFRRLPYRVDWRGKQLCSKRAASQLLLRVNPASRTAEFLGMGKKILVPLGVAISATAVSIRSYQWYSGEISSRQFVVERVAPSVVLQAESLVLGQGLMWAGRLARK